MKAKLGNELLEYPEILKCPVCAAWVELPKEVTAVIEAANEYCETGFSSRLYKLKDAVRTLKEMKGKE